MENTELRHYLVNFDVSDVYGLTVPMSKKEVESSPESVLVRMCHCLRDELQREFPGVTVPAEMVTAHVREVDAQKTDGYAPLDDKAKMTILDNLRNAMKNLEFQKGLSTDAPFNDAGPDTTSHI